MPRPVRDAHDDPGPHPARGRRAVRLQPPPPTLSTWVRAIRVRQWPKNLLVFGAPAAAGALERGATLQRVALAALAFCLLSSGTYLLNDLRDAREDRRHPVKRHRPIASGAIAPGRAVIVAIALVAAGLALSALLGMDSLAVAGAYTVLTIAYSAWLRHVAIADIVVIAALFVIRAAAGGVAAGIPISRWFFVVVSFSALFVAAGKRYADFLDLGSRQSRKVLAEYNADFLRMVIGTAAAVALTGYCLWAFQGPITADGTWREATVIPFTVALLRYGLLLTGGQGAAPEDILAGDRFMQCTAVAWIFTFLLAL